MQQSETQIKAKRIAIELPLPPAEASPNLTPDSLPNAKWANDLPAIVRLVTRTRIMPNGCWEPNYRTMVIGYTHLRDSGRDILSHRLAYEEWVGPIPDGYTIDHTCRNRRCVNPSHLEAVTRGENVLRGEGNSAKQARQTHCKRGHEFNDDNTYRPPGSPRKRNCRLCQRMHGANRRRARRA